MHLFKIYRALTNINKPQTQTTIVSARQVDDENFGLKPLLSLRSKTHKVIQEILLYIRARFAFKLGHANFPTNNNFLTYNIVLTPNCHKSCISYF